MQLSRLISMIVLAIIVAGSAALLTPAFIPTAKAQSTITSLSTSRDEWKNVWYAENFTVTAISSQNVGTNLSCILTVINPSGYTVYEQTVNLTLVPSVSYYGHYVYETLMGVNASGWLIWYTKTVQPIINVSSYGVGTTIKLSCGGLSKELVFEHVAPVLHIRSSIPYPPFYVVTDDIWISAPDLNKNPYASDVAVVPEFNITNLLYGGNITLVNAEVAEIGSNSGIFALTGTLYPQFVPIKGVNTTTATNVTQGSPAYVYYSTSNTLLNFSVVYYDTNVTNVTLLSGSYITTPVYYVNNTPFMVRIPITKDITLITAQAPNKTYTATFCAGTSIPITLQVRNKLYKLTIPIDVCYKMTFYVYIVNTSTSTSKTYTAQLQNIEVAVSSVSINPSYLYAYAWIAGVKFNVTIQPQPYEDLVVVPYQENAVGTTGYDVTSEYFTVFQTAGAVAGSGSLPEGLTIVVNDKGANFNSLAPDNVTVYVSCPSGTPSVPVVLYETGADTGIFTATESPAWVLAHFKSCINSTNNELYLTYIDAAGYVRTAVATIAYHTGSISVTPSKVIPGYSVITVTINDKDLTLNPVYTVTLSSGSPAIIPLTAKLVYNGETISVPLGKIMIFAYNASGTYLLKTTTSLVLRIIGTSSGTYILKLSLKDLTTIPGIEGYAIVYEDYYTSALKPENITATIGIIPVGIYVVEKEVPLTAAGPVILHVKIIDPSLNTNPLAVDSAHVIVEACTYAGACTALKNPSTGLYYWTIYETGANTGIFEGAIAVSLKNLGPKYIGGYLKLLYYSPAKAENLSTTVKLEVYGNVALYINGSTGPLTVKYGETLALQLHDMYYELNQLEVDKIPVSIANITYCTAGGCENLASLLPNLEFVETGANTGTFVAYVPVSKILGDVHNAEGKVCFTLYHIYRSPSTSPSSTTWMYDTTQPVKVCIVATPAKFEFYQGAPGAWAPLIYNESLKAYTVGPHAVINVTILDDDWNMNPEAVDTIPSSVISVVLIFNNGTSIMLPVTPKETGPNTGAFSFTIDLTKYKPSALAGGKIVIQYKDYIVGGYKKITEEIYIRTWNPTLIIYYNGKELKMPYPSVTTGALNITLPAKLKIVLIDKDLLANSVTITLSSTASIVPLKLTLYRNWSAPVPTYVGYVTLVSASQLAAPGQLPVNTKDVITITYVDELPYPYVGPKTDTWKVHVSVVTHIKPFIITISKLYVESGGKPVTVVKAGSIVYVAFNLSFSFMPKTPPSGKIVLEIFGPSGATVFVWEHSGVIYPGLSKLSWTVPKITGKYTIKLFVVYKYAGKTKFTEKSITIEVTS